MKPPREKDIERKVVKYCKTKGVLCLKFTSPGNRGVPDRMLIGANGRVGFLELKRKGQKPTGLQERTLRVFSRRKLFVGFTDTYEAAVTFVDNFIAFDALV